MTCAALADLLVDLAREAPIEANLRASALVHAAACRDCGERLAEQRMLTARLSELAAFDDGRDAPAWIETSLRARLRAESQEGAKHYAHGYGLRAKRDSLTQASGGSGGSAAGPPSSTDARRDSLPTRTRGVWGVHRSTEPIGNGQSANRIHFGEREGGQGGATQHPPAQRRLAWASVAAASAVLATVSLLTAQRGSATLPHPTEAPASAAADDDGSFLALPYGDSLDDLDAVQVVRVQVQPTALASLGWTGGAEAGSPVEAELLVGQDGIARGIRFVE